MGHKKQQTKSKTISNRRVTHDYTLDDSFLVGVKLTGRETKSLRHGRGQLKGAYVTIKGDELWLINATISSMPGILIEESEQTRARKLLAKRKEINNLISAKQQGLTIVPLELLTGSRFIKLRIATAKGKKLYDKRQSLKKRDETRQIHTILKERNRS